MSTRAISTPRGGRKYVTTALGQVIFLHQKRHSFCPQISSGPYVPPPPPPPLKRPPPPKEESVSSEELAASASSLRADAVTLETSSSATPPVNIALGLLLLTREGYIRKLLKEWDAKGKGEVARGEFRLHMRNLVPASSSESDALFDRCARRRSPRRVPCPRACATIPVLRVIVNKPLTCARLCACTHVRHVRNVHVRARATRPSPIL